MESQRKFLPPAALPSAMSRSLRILAFFSIFNIAYAVTADQPNLTFNRDIRPILSENCFHCHGPDAASREAGLRLDVEDQAKEWAIVAGDAESSEVISRIFSDDDDLLMPPTDSERKLSDAEKQTLRRWVQQGASYQRHWSFEPPRQPAVPKVAGSTSKTPIDRFIAAALKEAELERAPPAKRETLIRRITFDLIGLPPTIGEIDAYLADESPDATERLIDRLLADPRFGERMAADWLDVARYSDTYGYQVDRDRFVWPYRDWVVDAFNRNLGYDRFVTEQLAGDLLPDASRDQLLATTFNRLHPQKVEGGSVPEEFRVEYVADRTQTFGTAFLGLTLECCRCHSHKYDPITQTEYYEVASFFANIDEAGLYSFFTQSVPTPALALPTPEQERRLKADRDALAAIEKQYHRHLATTPSLNRFDRQSFRKKENATPSESTKALGDLPSESGDDTLFAGPVETMDFDETSPPVGGNTIVDGVRGGAVQLTGDDAVNLKQGNFPRYQPFSISLWINTPGHKERAVVFHRSRAWTDAASRGYQLLIEDGRLSWSLIHFWPGNAMRIRTVDPIPIDQWLHVTVTNDGSSTAAGLSLWMDGQRVATEVVRDGLTKNITGGGGDHVALGERFRDRGFTGGRIDRVRVFDCQLTQLEIERLARPDEALLWLDQPVQRWTDAQRTRVAEHLHRRHDADTRQLAERLKQARRRLCELQDRVQEIMVMRETPGLRTTHRLERGAYDSPAEAVSPGTPDAVLGFDAPLRRNRLGLANWLTRPDHPLTSRVAVNRLWQLCFGIGLVRTPEDFGSQGQPPTHPDLLDWLAMDFVHHDWDVKRMLKQIMLSAVYQASSQHPDPEVWKADPENRLFARHPVYRLPAEMLRDQALYLSGQLVSKVGGPPVRPYELEASFKPSKPDNGPGLYRRSLYTYWKRTGPAPAMMTLDASKRDVCRVRRERTSSPLQAFVLLNGPQYVEAARSLAIEILQEPNKQLDQQLVTAFRTLTGRQPTAQELVIVHELHDQQQRYFEAEPQRSAEFLSVGETKSPDQIKRSDLAALTMVISTLMNFDESVMKR